MIAAGIPLSFAVHKSLHIDLYGYPDLQHCSLSVEGWIKKLVSPSLLIVMLLVHSPFLSVLLKSYYLVITQQ